MKTEITSSIRLRLFNIIDLKPWLLMRILGEEFIKLTTWEAHELEYAFTEKNDVGCVLFNNTPARIYKSDDVLYIRFEDQRTYSLPLEDEN
jgi:hypothetical protein